MATQLKKIWQFLQKDVRELWQPTEAAESGAEVSKAVLELAIALGWLAPPVAIAAAGLSFVGIATRGIKYYREKVNKQPTLEEFVAIASPLAYLEMTYLLVSEMVGKTRPYSMIFVLGVLAVQLLLHKPEAIA